MRSLRTIVSRFCRAQCGRGWLWKRLCRQGWHRYVGDGGDVHRDRALRRLGPRKRRHGKIGFYRGSCSRARSRAVGKIKNAHRHRRAIMPAFELKQIISEYLASAGHEVIDVGTDSADPVDYPDFAEARRQGCCRRRRLSAACSFAAAA